MKKLLVGILAGMALLVAMGNSAYATTADGTIITNVATATFASAGGSGFTISYSVTARVQVLNPSMGLVKTASPTVQASGGPVTFRIWVINQSGMSSTFNVTVNDKLPDNTVYQSPSFAGWDGGSLGTWTSSYSPDNATWTNGESPDGTGNPLYLRWVLSWLGPNKSAMVEYTARIL